MTSDNRRRLAADARRLEVQIDFNVSPAPRLYVVAAIAGHAITQNVHTLAARVCVCV